MLCSLLLTLGTFLLFVPQEEKPESLPFEGSFLKNPHKDLALLPEGGQSHAQSLGPGGCKGAHSPAESLGPGFPFPVLSHLVILTNPCSR